MVAIACILWSCTNLMTGATSSLFVLAMMRALLGGFQGSYEPVAYSIIGDEIPQEKQPIANSIITATPLIGGGLTALNIILIATVGWRHCIQYMGLIGLVCGVSSLLFMKEPERISKNTEVSTEPIL